MLFSDLLSLHSCVSIHGHEVMWDTCMKKMRVLMLLFGPEGQLGR